MKHHTLGRSSRRTVEENPGSRVLILCRAGELREQLCELMTLWSIDHRACAGVVRAFSALADAGADDAPFDTLIVDAATLEIDPVQFARALRADETLAQPELVYLSPPLANQVEEGLLTGGYSHVVTLPVENRALFNALHVKGPENGAEGAIVDLFSRYREPRQIPRLEILVGEKNQIDQQRLSRLLQRSGHQTFLIGDGQEALDALDTHDFDLVILDSDLPLISGVEAFKLYCFAHPGEGRPPFILLLDGDAPEALSECAESGVDACLVKPVPDERLMETLVEVAGSRLEAAAHAIEPGAAASSRMPDIDYKRLSELQGLGAVDGFLPQLITDFNDTIDRAIEQMERSIAKGKSRKFRALGQSVKENAANLGALSLRRLGARAAVIDEGEIATEGRQLVADLRREQILTRKRLKEFLQEPALLKPRKES